METKVFEQYVLIVDIGCRDVDNWTLKLGLVCNIKITQRAIELGVSLKNRIRNKSINKITNVTDIVHPRVYLIRKLKWLWAGHVCQLGPMPMAAEKTVPWSGDHVLTAEWNATRPVEPTIYIRKMPNWIRIAGNHDVWCVLE